MQHANGLQRMSDLIFCSIAQVFNENHSFSYSEGARLSPPRNKWEISSKSSGEVDSAGMFCGYVEVLTGKALETRILETNFKLRCTSGHRGSKENVHCGWADHRLESIPG